MTLEIITYPAFTKVNYEFIPFSDNYPINIEEYLDEETHTTKFCINYTIENKDGTITHHGYTVPWLNEGNFIDGPKARIIDNSGNCIWKN